MITRRRISALVLAAVFSTVPLVAVTSAAQADTSGPAGFGEKQCNPIGNGRLCATPISGSPDGYDASYEKTAGPPLKARFYLECKDHYWAQDNGEFSISAGQTRSFVFSVGNHGLCHVLLKDLTHNAGPFESPWVQP